MLKEDGEAGAEALIGQSENALQSQIKQSLNRRTRHREQRLIGEVPEEPEPAVNKTELVQRILTRLDSECQLDIDINPKGHRPFNSLHHSSDSRDSLYDNKAAVNSSRRNIALGQGISKSMLARYNKRNKVDLQRDPLHQNKYSGPSTTMKS